MAAQDQMRDLEKRAEGCDQNANNERIIQETKDLFSGGPLSKMFFGLLGAFVLIFAVFEAFHHSQPALRGDGLHRPGTRNGEHYSLPRPDFGLDGEKGRRLLLPEYPGRGAAKRAGTRDGLHTADPNAPGVTIRTFSGP